MIANSSSIMDKCGTTKKPIKFSINDNLDDMTGVACVHKNDIESLALKCPNTFVFVISFSNTQQIYSK